MCALKEAQVSNSKPDNPEDFHETIDLATLAKRQGVAPFDFARIRSRATFWPDEESIDDFIATVRRWRDEG
jgi:hypothetical protein